MSTTPEHDQVSMLSAADLKSLLNNVDLSHLAAELNANVLNEDISNVLPTLHDAETIEFQNILPLVNGNGETCGSGDVDDDEIISDNELHNLSLSPLKTSDFCDYATTSAPTSKRRRHSCSSNLSSYCVSTPAAKLLRRIKSLSSVTLSSTEHDVQFLRRDYPRRRSSPSLLEHRHVETVDVLGYKLPLVTGLTNCPYGTDGQQPYVCVSDVFQTFFNRRHWDEFKEILSKNNIEPVYDVVRNAYGQMEDVSAITVDQCRSLLLNNQARKEGFVRCIRLSVDGGVAAAAAAAAAGADSSNAVFTPCTTYASSVATPCGGETTLIQAAERQVGELSSGIRTRHADQSDIIYVEFDNRTLPSIAINDRQYVRLVDVHKSILANDNETNTVLSKHVGQLKKLCADAGIEVGKCRPNEKARLVVYANSYRSNSLHVIAAEELPKLVSLYRYRAERRQQPGVKRKYMKRSRTVDDGYDDVDDREFDEACSMMYEKHYKRLRNDLDCNSRDDKDNFAACNKVSNSKRRRPFYSVVDDIDGDEQPSRPSSALSTETTQSCCSDDNLRVTSKNAPLLRPGRPSSAGDVGSSIRNDYANFVAPPVVTTGGVNCRSNYSTTAAVTTTTTTTTTASRKTHNSFEQMLASADDFYKSRPPSNNTNAKFRPGNDKILEQSSMGISSNPNGGKKSQFFDKNTHKSRSHSLSQTNLMFNGDGHDSAFSSSKNLFDKFNASTFTSSTAFKCNVPSKNNKHKSLCFNSTPPFKKSSKITHNRRSSPNFADSPPPFITPEIAVIVDADNDLDLGRDESLVTDLPIKTHTRPCAVYLNRSAPLPVAVYNRRFQRGAAGYYHDHLFVNRSSQCILCLKCKTFTTLRYFVGHTHDSSTTLADPMLFMFVRNPTSDRFDLWRNLCLKAKRFSLEKYVNYTLPDHLSEYYEEQRHAATHVNNVKTSGNNVVNNSVNIGNNSIVNVDNYNNNNNNNNNSNNNNNNTNVNDDQQSQNAAAQILLSLARGK